MTKLFSILCEITKSAQHFGDSEIVGGET